MSTFILAGYHANNVDGQTTPNPYICPELMYCPEGSQIATMCENGYWIPWQGATASTDCIPCDRGKWCLFKNMESDSDFITFMTSNPSFTFADLQAYMGGAVLNNFYGSPNDGYLCYEGCTSPTPSSIASANGEPCPIGYYCTSDNMMASPCLPGTYNPRTQ
jgi:hypothetical protein